MSPEQTKNIVLYVLYAVAGALVATGLRLATILSGNDDVTLALIWRPLAATFTTALFGALATAAGASRLGPLGSEGVNAQVATLRDQGVHRSDMVVLPKSEAVAVLEGDGSVSYAAPPAAATVATIADNVMELSPKERAQLQAIVDRRHADMEAEQGASRG